MPNHCGTRLPRRHRRPSPAPVSRSQARQKINQLQTLYQMEALLELNRTRPDVAHLLRLDQDAGLLQEMASLEEQL